MNILASLITFLCATRNSERNIESYRNQEPLLLIDKYFVGKFFAHGMIQNWRGRVVRRFRVDMEGDWKDDEGTIKEHFYSITEKNKPDMALEKS